MENKSPKACPRCGEGFTCGMAAGEQSCWCAELPNVISLDGILFPGDDVKYEDCLCPNCLQELIGQVQESMDSD